MGLLYLLLWISTGIAGIATLHMAPSLAFLFLAIFLIAGLIGYSLALRGGTLFRTDAPVYIASRLAANNLLYPTQVAILPSQVIRHKAKLIGSDQESINMAQIASVKISTNILWSNVIIESSGGQAPILCHGHLNRDAITIKTTIEQYQQEYFQQRAHPKASPAGTPSDPSIPSTSFVLTLYHPTSSQTPAAPLKQMTYTTTDSPPLHDLLVRLLTEGGPGSYVTVQQSPSPPRTKNTLLLRTLLLTALYSTALSLTACAGSQIPGHPSLPPVPPAAPASAPPAAPLPAPSTPFSRIILPTPPRDSPEIPHAPINAERVTFPTPPLDTPASTAPDPPSDITPASLTDILFDYDSAIIRPDAAAILRDNLGWLHAHPLATITIEGHCDQRGSAEYNLALGQHRADAVRAYLITAGLAPGRLATISYGKTLPFALDHSESAWQLNRRAHFRLTNPRQ